MLTLPRMLQPFRKRMYVHTFIWANIRLLQGLKGHMGNNKSTDYPSFPLRMSRHHVQVYLKHITLFPPCSLYFVFSFIARHLMRTIHRAEYYTKITSRDFRSGEKCFGQTSGEERIRFLLPSANICWCLQDIFLQF